MRVVHICWYLCVLFAVALLVISAITVVPGRESVVQTLMVGSAVLAIAFGSVAVVLRRVQPTERRWVLRAFQAVAVLATIVVLLLIGG